MLLAKTLQLQFAYSLARQRTQQALAFVFSLIFPNQNLLIYFSFPKSLLVSVFAG
jgi:hypothetical protein